jgi:hypothetical protein
MKTYRDVKKCSAHPHLYDFLEKSYLKQNRYNKIRDFIVGLLIIIMAGALAWLAVTK